MSKGDPKIDSESVEEIKKKNLTREENIKKETDKIKNLVDLILKSPKQKIKKSSVEKKPGEKDNPTKKKEDQKNNS